METFHWLQMLGIMYLVMGAAMVLNPGALKGAMDELPHNKLATLSLAVINVVFGAVMVTMHQLWTTPQEILVSAIGWLALLKGFMYVAFPNTVGHFKGVLNGNGKIRTVGVFCLAAGGALVAWAMGWI